MLSSEEDEDERDGTRTEEANICMDVYLQWNNNNEKEEEEKKRRKTLNEQEADYNKIWVGAYTRDRKEKQQEKKEA